MTIRSVMAVVLAVVIVISAIEVSTWALGRAVSAVVPSASVSDVNVPHAPEIDEPLPTGAPAITW